MVKKPHKLLGGSELYTEVRRVNPGLLGEEEESSVPKRTCSISKKAQLTSGTEGPSFELYSDVAGKFKDATLKARV